MSRFLKNSHIKKLPRQETPTSSCKFNFRRTFKSMDIFEQLAKLNDLSSFDKQHTNDINKLNKQDICNKDPTNCTQSVIYSKLLKKYEHTMGSNDHKMFSFDDQSIYEVDPFESKRVNSNPKHVSLMPVRREDVYNSYKSIMTLCPKCQNVSRLMIGTSQIRRSDEGATVTYICTICDEL